MGLFGKSKQQLISEYMQVANQWNSHCAARGHMWHLGDMSDIERIKQLDSIVCSWRSQGDIDKGVLKDSIKLMKNKMQ